jgi:hypothetical protein
MPIKIQRCRSGKSRLCSTGMGKKMIAMSRRMLMDALENQTADRFKHFPGTDGSQNRETGTHKKTLLKMVQAPKTMVKVSATAHTI